METLDELKLRLHQGQVSFDQLADWYWDKEQELAELKGMVRYRLYLQRMLNAGEIQVGGLGKLDATDKWLEQACTLANKDSKEE